MEEQPQEPHREKSKRKVKKVGFGHDQTSALAQLKAAKESGISRTVQYQHEQERIQRTEQKKEEERQRRIENGEEEEYSDDDSFVEDDYNYDLQRKKYNEYDEGRKEAFGIQTMLYQKLNSKKKNKSKKTSQKEQKKKKNLEQESKDILKDLLKDATKNKKKKKRRGRFNGKKAQIEPKKLSTKKSAQKSLVKIEVEVEGVDFDKKGGQNTEDQEVKNLENQNMLKNEQVPEKMEVVGEIVDQQQLEVEFKLEQKKTEKEKIMDQYDFEVGGESENENKDENENAEEKDADITKSKSNLKSREQFEKNLEVENTNTESKNIVQNDDELFSKEKSAIPLQTEYSKDNLNFYWIDIFENKRLYPGKLFLFGKVYVIKKKCYESICIVIKNIKRLMYFIPTNPQADEKDIMKLDREIEKLRQNRFRFIKSWLRRPVDKKYAFDLDIEKGKRLVLEVFYDFTFPPLPRDLKGQHFSHVIGTTYTPIEIFLIMLKIKGPCWLKIPKGKFQEAQSSRRHSRCKQEIIVEDMDNIEKITNPNIPTPMLKFMFLSVKTIRNKQKRMNEIALITTYCVQKDISQNNNKSKNFKNNRANRQHPPLFLSFLKKPNTSNFPFDLEKEVRKHGNRICRCLDERGMLDQFTRHVEKYDPDFFVGHDLYTNHLDVIISRLATLREQFWNRVSRLRFRGMPARGDTGSVQWKLRQATPGRLLCDTFTSAEGLVKETNYDLTHLSKSRLNKTRIEITNQELQECYKKSQTILEVIFKNEKDLTLCDEIMENLQVIPLTLQLTNIAGNTWIRSLQNSRAERNAMFLMHEFYNKGYIFPDRQKPAQKRKKFRRRGKKKYAGGLVLEPKSGLYDKFVMLLDFNSLYPSIIQEFNICFTTVEKPECPELQPDAGDEFTEEEKFNAQDVYLNKFLDTYQQQGKQEQKRAKWGILPKTIKKLIDKRKIVKRQMKSEKNPAKKKQLDIIQRSLKLTANSMYGCLGFTTSRFYAKHLAALITGYGRRILEDTVKTVEDQLNYDVVYGDTDSVMINTKTYDLKEAIKIGYEIKAFINKKYKLLELDIDGVFKSLLLLRKKKYAALLVDNYNEILLNRTIKPILKKEIKGLDMVRRDWCNLSKTASKQVLDFILSGEKDSQNDKEQIIHQIYEYLQNLGKQIQSNKIKLSQYIITKQLSKSVHDYPDGKNQPHVKVVKDQLNKGKAEQNFIHHYIPYIICQGDQKSYADRAYHPGDFKSLKLKIDTSWYLTQQVMPPLARLCQHIQEINISQMAIMLGLDGKRYQNYGKKNDYSDEDDDILNQEDIPHDKDIELKTFCEKCQKFVTFEGYYNSNKKSGFFCSECEIGHLCVQTLENHLRMTIRNLILKTYRQQTTCDDFTCQNKSTSMTISGKCEQIKEDFMSKKCEGRRRYDQSCTRLLNNLKYLRKLFEEPLEAKNKTFSPQMNGKNANNADVNEIYSKDDQRNMGKLRAIVHGVISQSDYQKVDLSKICFMFKGISLQKKDEKNGLEETENIKANNRKIK